MKLKVNRVKIKILNSDDPRIHIGIICICIIALFFIFQQLVTKIDEAQARVPFEFGDQAPGLEKITTMNAKEFSILPAKKKITVLIFFKPDHIEILEQINILWQDIFIQQPNIRLLGVLCDEFTPEIDPKLYSFPIVHDNNYDLQKRYHFYPLSNLGSTLILDHDLKVLLSVHAILRMDLLEDSINRKIKQFN